MDTIMFIGLAHTEKTICIGEGFGHKILAQTWPNLWVTSGVPWVQMIWIGGASHSWFILMPNWLLFCAREAPCNIFDHVSQFHKEKNDELVPRDGDELAWHQVQPPQADLVLLSSRNQKWNGTDVMSHRASAAHPLWTSLAYDLFF